MLIVIDMGFKSDMVEGGRGININNEKGNQPQNFPGLPPIFRGFPNWNFPGPQNQGQPKNVPGFPAIPFFGLPSPSPGGGGGGDNLPPIPGLTAPSPLLPFLPYFRFDPPRYCIHLVGCIPLPKFQFPGQVQSPQATPVLSPPPDQGPLTPAVQPLPINPSPSQPPPAQTNPLQPPPVQSPPAQTPPVPPPTAQTPGVPTVPTPALQAEALTPTIT